MSSNEARVRTRLYLGNAIGNNTTSTSVWRHVALLLCVLALTGCARSGTKTRPSGTLVSGGAIVSISQDTLKNVRAVAAGDEHTLALTFAGSIIAWGNNMVGQCDVPAPNADFVAIAAGGTRSYGLKQDGQIVWWGELSGSIRPGTQYTTIAADESRFLAVAEDGHIEALTNSGGTYHFQDLPAPNDGFVGVAVARGVVIGLRRDGAIVRWGKGSEDRLADNRGFMAVSSGANNVCAVRADGAGHIWHQFGRMETLDPDIAAAVVLSPVSGSCVLKKDGTISSSNPRGVHSAPSPNENFKVLTSGKSHYVALRADGTVACWSDSYSDAVPLPFSCEGIAAVAVGGQHCLGLRSDGSIVAWGDNESTQCNVPIPNENYIAIAAGSQHSLALKSDGTIVAWGSDKMDECTVPSREPFFVSIAAGDNFSLALARDGAVVAWGDNRSGQCSVPPPNLDFVAISAGSTHSMGIKSDGSIVVWGDCPMQQCDIPATNGPFKAIACTRSASWAVKSDGSVVAWADGNTEPSVQPTGDLGYVSISANTFYVYGLKTDGSIELLGWKVLHGIGRREVKPPLGIPAQANRDFVAIATGPDGRVLGIRGPMRQ